MKLPIVSMLGILFFFNLNFNPTPAQAFGGISTDTVLALFQPADCKIPKTPELECQLVEPNGGPGLDFAGYEELANQALQKGKPCEAINQYQLAIYMHGIIIPNIVPNTNSRKAHKAQIDIALEAKLYADAYHLGVKYLIDNRMREDLGPEIKEQLRAAILGMRAQAQTMREDEDYCEAAQHLGYYDHLISMSKNTVVRKGETISVDLSGIVAETIISRYKGGTSVVDHMRYEPDKDLIHQIAKKNKACLEEFERNNPVPEGDTEAKPIFPQPNWYEQRERTCPSSNMIGQPYPVFYSAQPHLWTQLPVLTEMKEYRDMRIDQISLLLAGEFSNPTLRAARAYVRNFPEDDPQQDFSHYAIAQTYTLRIPESTGLDAKTAFMACWAWAGMKRPDFAGSRWSEDAEVKYKQAMDWLAQKEFNTAFYPIHGPSVFDYSGYNSGSAQVWLKHMTDNYRRSPLVPEALYRLAKAYHESDQIEDFDRTLRELFYWFKKSEWSQKAADEYETYILANW